MREVCLINNVLLIAEGRIATVQLLESTLAHLVAQGEISLSTLLEKDVKSEHFSAGTLPVLVRTCTQDSVKLAKTLRRHGVPYAFYIDDNFWKMDASTTLGAYYSDPVVQRRLDFVTRHAHIVIASTPLLTDFVRQFNANTVHLDAAHDFTLIPELPPLPEHAGQIRFGFAGSAYRGVDVEALEAEIVALLDSDARLEFEVIGAQVALGDHPRIRVWGYLDSYEEYVALQRSREWHFALAPLGDGEAKRYKTDVKYREYGAQGIPAIYQDAPPYETVRDQHTGLLAGKARSWTDAMSMFIADAELRASVRAAARKDVEQRYGADRVAPLWLAALRSVPWRALSDTERAQLLADIDKGPPRASVIRARFWALWRFARVEAAREGVAQVARRTVRFIWRRVRRR